MVAIASYKMFKFVEKNNFKTTYYMNADAKMLYFFKENVI